MSFNSLQTGKCIQSPVAKRHTHTQTKGFQFPSNGKVYPKFSFLAIFMVVFLVSIPFKRESVSKVLFTILSVKYSSGHGVSIPFKRESVSKGDTEEEVNGISSYSFQFPSNGKVYPKKFVPYEQRVEIDHSQFQFPSNGKVYPKLLLSSCIVREKLRFQFPSNGKVYPK